MLIILLQNIWNGSSDICVKLMTQIYCSSLAFCPAYFKQFSQFRYTYMKLNLQKNTRTSKKKALCAYLFLHI